MIIKSTIQFNATRTVSASGNTEWYEFTITSTRLLTKTSVEQICQMHGCFGQSFDFTETKADGIFTYSGSATCYCD